MTDQCGLAADGTLLDASQIPWYNDPDDDVPLPTARRSTRIPRPAPKLIDPNNALLGKRKAVAVVVSEEEDEGDAVTVDGVFTDADIENMMDTDNDSPSTTLTYQQTKEMGNADRKVSYIFFSYTELIFCAGRKAMQKRLDSRHSDHIHS
jgi:hypothetical protein